MCDILGDRERGEIGEIGGAARLRAEGGRLRLSQRSELTAPLEDEERRHGHDACLGSGAAPRLPSSSSSAVATTSSSSGGRALGLGALAFWRANGRGTNLLAAPCRALGRALFDSQWIRTGSVSLPLSSRRCLPAVVAIVLLLLDLPPPSGLDLYLTVDAVEGVRREHLPNGLKLRELGIRAFTRLQAAAGLGACLHLEPFDDALDPREQPLHCRCRLDLALLVRAAFQNRQLKRPRAGEEGRERPRAGEQGKPREGEEGEATEGVRRGGPRED